MATKTPIDSGIIARITGAFNVLTGKTPPQNSIDNGQAWFGPLNPPQPQLSEQQQESVRGRQFDFPVGANLRYRPRADEAVSYDQMRALVSACDILRIVIETRKDQISKMAFNIKVRGDEKAADVRCDEVAEFFRRPDGENTWADWLRQLVDEMLVTDAATVYPWLTNSGKPYRFELLDGASIKRVITDKGRTPEFPDPAYQQILKGVPAINYNRNELVYAPRNKRVYKIYGCSPVEQIVMTVNIAIRRSLHQLQYYTDGSTPDLIFQTPADWNMTQIKDFNDWWQDSLSGNTAVRRKAQFVPNGVNPINTKDAILKDQYDEWLARIICYAFSISPQAFVKEQNRATAESAREQALAEGLQPMMAWVKGVIDELILRYFGYDDIEFVWDLAVNVDPEVQARIDDMGLKNGSKTINEVRAKHGEDPVEGGDEAMVLTGSGYVSIIPAPVVQPEITTVPDTNVEEVPPEPPTPTNKIEKAQKPKKIIQPINRNSPKHNQIREDLAKGLKAIFKDQREALTKSITKGDGDAKKNPVDEDGWQDWQYYNDLFNENLSAAAKLGTTAAYVQIGLDSESSLKVANKHAIDWALERSAYMVGKTVDENGDIVDNPNADYAIDDSTREMLRADVAQAMEEGMSNDELADLISENYAFSDARAETIARTETANADCAGNEILYKDSGVVSQKEWATGADCCDDCDVLNGEIVDLDENFSNGESSPPAHPNCVLASTLVAGANITKYFKHSYEGLIFQISTADGEPLNVTANHPILTTRGWIAAKDISCGDIAIKTMDQNFAICGIDERQVNMPNRIDEAFSSLVKNAEPLELDFVKSDPSNFHGDGASENCTIIAHKNYNGLENTKPVIKDSDLENAEKRKEYSQLELFEAKVINITSFEYEGDVYNVETEGGWFFANGVVTHNCRCDFLPVLSEEEN